MKLLERAFRLQDFNTDVRTEVLAGATTFLTMSYILAVNPSVLAETGMSKEAVFVATVAAAVVGSLIMGLFANWPVGVAPGLGLNAYFTYGIVLSLGYPWQEALGAVFWSGVLFLIISVTKIRGYLLGAIPPNLKFGIGTGVGLFVLFIGLRSAGIVVDNPATFVAIGDLGSPEALLAVLGFFLIVFFASLGLKAAVILGILAVTALSIALGLNEFRGLVGAVPDIEPVFLQLDLLGALQWGVVSVVVTLLFVDFFDTAGALTSIRMMMGKGDGEAFPYKALTADSSATVVGALLGTSNSTTYVESSTGIQAGGRTGLTALVIALLFAVSLVFFPLVNSIPAYATAPALIYVGLLFFRNLGGIDFSDISEAIPTSITVLMIPLTFSIGNGILLGFISYVLLKLIYRRWEDLNLPIAILAALGVVNFAFLL